MKKRVYFYFLLFCLILKSQGIFGSCSSHFRQDDEMYEKIIGLFNWLKTTYPDEDRKTWDETCNLLVNWSITDTLIDVTVNIDVVEELLNEEGFKYKVESLRIYTLGVVVYYLQHQSNLDMEEATYNGMLGLIEFYNVITEKNNTVGSHAIKKYIRLNRKGALNDYINAILLDEK